VIKTFKSRALKAFWENNDASKLDAKLVKPLIRRLDALHAATRPQDMNIQGFDFHRLKGDRKNVYTVHVNGPWCVTFEWEAPDAVRVDFEQYH
jgi:proteic killer suppression protein